MLISLSLFTRGNLYQILKKLTRHIFELVIILKQTVEIPVLPEMPLSLIFFNWIIVYILYLLESTDLINFVFPT